MTVNTKKSHERKKRYPILIFEGVDKSGKTTILELFKKKTNYMFPCVDRLMASCWVYGKYRKRQINERDIIRQDETISKISILVYVKASPEIILKRMISEKETDIKEKDIIPLQKLYSRYINKITKSPVIILDTSDKSPLESVYQLIDELKAWMTKLKMN